MKKVYLITILLLSIFHLNGQNLDTLNQETGPIGGVNALALTYYRIDFTKAQRKSLVGVEIEFIYQVDEKGNPVLEEINGIADPIILDSLKKVTPNLPRFYPALKNGTPQSALFFMQLIFPRYKMTERSIGMNETYVFNQAKMDDFEFIEKVNTHFDMMISGVANHFIGNPANYLDFGGGVKLDLTYTGKKSFYYGMAMNVYSNKLKNEFPLGNCQ